jgi:hypothetical protein
MKTIFYYLLISFILLVHFHSHLYAGTSPPTHIPTFTPCQQLADWKKQWPDHPFPGIQTQIGTLNKCMPVLISLTHNAFGYQKQECGKNIEEVNFNYSITHEGTMWFNRNFEKVLIETSWRTGQRLNYNLMRADGYYFAYIKACGGSDKYQFDINDVKYLDHGYLNFTINYGAGAETEEILYNPFPFYFERSEDYYYHFGEIFNFSIEEEAQAQINLELTSEKIKEAFEGKPIKANLNWIYEEDVADDMVIYTHNELNFELIINGSPGILKVEGNDLNSTGPNCKKSFDPYKTTYTLTNTGDQPIEILINSNKSWITLSSNSITLGRKSSKTVTVSINNKALELKDGKYKADISFTNTTNSNGNTKRFVNLEIAPEECWLVRLKGYEKVNEKLNREDENNNHIILNAGAKFNYDFEVDVIIKRKNGKWKLKEAKVIKALLSQNKAYNPTNVWKFGTSYCYGCKAIKNLNLLTGIIKTGTRELILDWPPLVTKLYVPAKRLNCKPGDPSNECAGGGEAAHESQYFFKTAAADIIILKDNWTDHFEKDYKSTTSHFKVFYDLKVKKK